MKREMKMYLGIKHLSPRDILNSLVMLEMITPKYQLESNQLHSEALNILFSKYVEAHLDKSVDVNNPSIEFLAGLKLFGKIAIEQYYHPVQILNYLDGYYSEWITSPEYQNICDGMVEGIEVLKKGASNE